MRLRLATWWSSLVSTFWFLPGITMVVALALAIFMPLLDMQVDSWVIERLSWLQMTPSAAQQLLASIGGAMVTVAGVVFSITIVTLSIATSQLGPRLLRTFMGNLTTQLALGLFVGTSLYCMLVLATVRTDESMAFVPHLSVMLGVLLAVLCLAVLIVFTHAVATLVQAPNIVKEVAEDLDHAILRVFPEPFRGKTRSREEGADWREHVEGLGAPALQIKSPFEGYVQALDLDAILDLAERHDAIVRLLDRPGKFLVRENSFAHVWWCGAEGDTPAVERGLVAALTVGTRPTPVQDVEGAINELVEVALRALSPSLNDPFTAMNCIDRLAASMGRLAAREIPPPIRRGSGGHIRLITPPLNFPTVLETAFNQIRQYGRDSVATTIRLLEGLQIVGDAVAQEADRRAVLLQAEMVLKGAERSLDEPHDLAAVRERFENVRKVLQA